MGFHLWRCSDYSAQLKVVPLTFAKDISINFVTCTFAFHRTQSLWVAELTYVVCYVALSVPDDTACNSHLN